jgi:hypothetical protein
MVAVDQLLAERGAGLAGDQSRPIRNAWAIRPALLSGVGKAHRSTRRRQQGRNCGRPVEITGMSRMPASIRVDGG